MMRDDVELLRQYAEANSHDAFAELVRRRVDMVYAVAVRHSAGNAHAAEEVTQLVFTELARKAKVLSRHPVLEGWLFKTTHFTAAKLLRAEARRRRRESEALAMSTNADAETLEREQIRPLLDDAMMRLPERDREAVLLRFFSGLGFAELGARLNLTEEGARSRVTRALDKMQGHLARRGITSTSAALATTLGAQAGSAPAGLAATVAQAATPVGLGGSSLIVTLMASSQVKIAAGVAIIAISGTAWLIQSTPKRLEDPPTELSLPFSTLTTPPAQAQASDTASPAPALQKVSVAFASDDAPSVRRNLIPVSRQVQFLDDPGLGAFDVPPRPIQISPGRYPEALQGSGANGQAIIEFIVETNGRVSQVQYSSATDMLFAEEAVRAAGEWMFHPAQAAGLPVRTRMRMPVMFVEQSTESNHPRQVEMSGRSGDSAHSQTSMSSADGPTPHRVGAAGIILDGHMMDEEVQRFVLTDSSGAASPWLELGQQFRDYTLISFDTESQLLTLRKGDEDVRIPLRDPTILPADNRATEPVVAAVHISQTGQIRMNGEPVDLSGLERELKSIALTNSKFHLVYDFSREASADLDQVLTVLPKLESILRRAGFKQWTIRSASAPAQNGGVTTAPLTRR